MPMYDTVLQEKPPVVLEIGAAFSKLGFSAEAYPRFIIPSETYLSATGEIKNIFDYKDSNELYDQMVDFLQMVFFKYIAVTPKERKVIIVESAFNPTSIRETLGRVLFKHFDVSSVYFVSSHLVAISTLAIQTALVIDFGYEEVTVMPVYCGVQLLNAFQGQPYAAKSIHNEIRRQLLESGVKEEYLTEKILEDIKVRTCFVTNMERSKLYKMNNPPVPCPDVDYPIFGKDVIKIPGKLRETVYEIMFPEDNDHQGLPYIILDAILKCSLDMRKPLAENLFLIGGGAMVMGLMARLKSELLTLLESNLYKEKLFLKKFKFHKAPSKENFTAWLGGSIYGGTAQVLMKSLTKETYSRHLRIPDWINLDDI